MHEEIAEFSLKKAQELGCRYVEVRVEERSSNGFVLKNGNPDISGFDMISGIGIRYLINNNLGFVSTNNFDREKISQILRRSVSTTRNSSRISKDVCFSDEKKEAARYKVAQREKIQDFTGDKKLNILKEIDGGIKKLPQRYLTLHDEIAEKYYLNSEGSRVYSFIPKISLMYFLTISESKKSIQRYMSHGSSSGYEIIKKWNLIEKIPEEAEILKDNLVNGIKSPKGDMDLVIGSEVAGIAVHESVGHPYETDRILGREAAQAGESFITNKMLNTKIGSKIVNVIEDPTLENSYGFYLYDDEGVKARKKYLIKNGMVNEFLHNRETAFEMNTHSNGCSRANNYDVEPLIRMSNTYVKSGDSSEDEIIRETKKGIYMKSYMQWNIDDKRYHQRYTGGEAYMIEKGELTRPVIAPVMEVKTPTLWSSIDMIGNKIEMYAGNCGKGNPMQGIPVYFGGPVMRLKNIMVK